MDIEAIFNGGIYRIPMNGPSGVKRKKIVRLCSDPRVLEINGGTYVAFLGYRVRSATVASFGESASYLVRDADFEWFHMS